MEPIGDKYGITAEWLTEALREGGHLPQGRVRALDVADIGVGRGYISQAVRVTPTYEGANGDAPASLVAKVPTFVQVPGYLTPWSAMIIETEIHWYRDASGECPARVPGTFGGVHEERTSYALLLEDLGELGTLSQTDSCPPEQAPNIVRTLARMHAHWWESDRLREWTWLPSSERQAAINAPLVQGGWEAFAARIVPRVDPAFGPVGERLVRDWGTLYERGAASGATLIHGDFRIENFLFGEPGADNELVILDWQLASYGSGPRDLAYFIAQGFDPERRKAVGDELLALYHATLVEHGVRGYSFEQCRHDYRLGLLLSMLIPLIGVQGVEAIAPPPPEASEEDHQAFRDLVEAAEGLILLMAERNIAAIMDANAGELLGA